MALRSGLVAALTALALLVAPTAAADEPVEPPPPTVVAVEGVGISGNVSVGNTATATPPIWDPAAAATSFQWLRDGAAIEGATSSSYALVPDDFGKRISVRATGTLEGYLDGTSTAAFSVPIAAGLLFAADPVVVGTARVGSTVRSSVPSWNVEGVTTTYAWWRGGTVVSRGPTRRLTPTDLSKGPIRVEATGTTRGYDTRTVASRWVWVGKSLSRVKVGGSSARAGSLRLDITVTAPGRSVTGSVRVSEGSKVLAGKVTVRDGRAVYTKTGLRSGPHRYTVRYLGTASIASSTGFADVRIKAKVTPVIALKPTTGVGRVRIGITVTAPGQPPLGGTAYVKEGRKTLKSTIRVVRSKASFSASGVKPGRHTYLVGYRGTSQVRAATRSVTVRVPAPAKLVRYANCKALNQVHPHGVGRSGAKDKTSGTPVTTFLRDRRLYEYQDPRRDADKDGIACEKR